MHSPLCSEAGWGGCAGPGMVSVARSISPWLRLPRPAMPWTVFSQEEPDSSEDQQGQARGWGSKSVVWAMSPNGDIFVPVRSADTHPVPDVLLCPKSAGQLGLAAPEPHFLLTAAPGGTSCVCPGGGQAAPLCSPGSREGAGVQEELLMSGRAASPQKEPCPPFQPSSRAHPTPGPPSSSAPMGMRTCHFPVRGQPPHLYHGLS